MTISLVENLIILVAGLGLGLLASWGVGAIIGICYSINIFINMSTFLIVSLILSERCFNILATGS